MNIPSIFSVSKLLTPASFKEELTNIYNIVSCGRGTMDKLWVLYWLVASLSQDEKSFKLCNKVMIEGYLNEKDTEELNLVLRSLIEKSAGNDFNTLLDFSKNFYDPELLSTVIVDNFMDVLIVDFLDEIYEVGLYSTDALGYAKNLFEFNVPGINIFPRTSIEELEIYLKNWISRIDKIINSLKYHGVQSHYKTEIAGKRVVSLL